MDAIAQQLAAVTFDDLLTMRFGGEGLMLGSGASEIQPLETADKWQEKATALQQLSWHLYGKIPSDHHVPLALRIESETSRDCCVHREVSYAIGPNERIRADILIPTSVTEPRPGVITIHQTTSFGREQPIGRDPDAPDMAYGLHLAKRGFVTLSYDLDSAHERRYEGCRDFDNGAFYKKHPEWSARGKDIWDVSRAVDVLEATPEVDATRIGAIGHSQGGGITIDAMGHEPRLKVGVSNCGDWPFRMSKNPFNRARTGWWIGNPHLRPFMIAGKEIPIDLHEKLALIAPRAIMQIVALNDCQFGLDEIDQLRPGFANLETNVQRLFELVGAGGKFAQVLHSDGHVFTEPYREQAYSFLAEHL